MKLTTTPQEFQTSSLQLLRAYPASTKITITYHAATPGKGTLTLKTYDPVSGAVIKFKTTKIADVGRLIAGLHRLAREQMGAPE
ncbi:signal recognition particle 9 kDa protein-domain-containing protein, partial [Trichophaea hybrida]